MTVTPGTLEGTIFGLWLLSLHTEALGNELERRVCDVKRRRKPYGSFSSLSGFLAFNAPGSLMVSSLPRWCAGVGCSSVLLRRIY